MLATNFSFKIENTTGGANIVLTRNADLANKVFFMAGVTPNGHADLARHMESLTDSQCESFLPGAKVHHKTKKQ